MNVVVLTSDPGHPVVPHLERWIELLSHSGHAASIQYSLVDLPTGADILFLVSCGTLVPPSVRTRFRSVLVAHASPLPQRRGWSPHIWAVLDGESEITVSLLEAADPVDTGKIWLQTSFVLEGHELLLEINQRLFEAELELMTQCIQNFEFIVPREQADTGSTYVRRRTPADSRLDPSVALCEQFDLLRVVDNARYPAFFDYRGHRYVLEIKKQQTGGSKV